MEIVHTPVLLNECLEYLSPVGESFEANAQDDCPNINGIDDSGF